MTILDSREFKDFSPFTENCRPGLGRQFTLSQKACQTLEKNRCGGEFSFSEAFSPAAEALYQPDEPVCIVDMTVYTPDEAFDTLDELFFNADLVV